MRSTDKRSIVGRFDDAIKKIDEDEKTLSRLYLSTLAPFVAQSYQLSLAGRAVTDSLATLRLAKAELERAKGIIQDVPVTSSAKSLEGIDRQ